MIISPSQFDPQISGRCVIKTRQFINVKNYFMFVGIVVNFVALKCGNDDPRAKAQSAKLGGLCGYVWIVEVRYC